MLRKKLTLGVLSLLMIGSSLSAESLSRTQAAAERLARVYKFAIGGVGFAGQTSDGEKDFRLVMQDAQAAKVFDMLYAQGNNEAKAYALLGLHRLNPARFREIYATLLKSKEELQVMQGCILFKERLEVVARQINDGGFAEYGNLSVDRVTFRVVVPQ